MANFESSVKVIPYSQERVYAKLSDLSNLESVKDRLPEDKVQDLSFDSDTLSFNVSPVGQIKLTIGMDINPFMKAMVQKPLQDGLEKMVEMLSMIQY